MAAPWRVAFTREAEKTVDALAAPLRQRLLRALARLAEDPLAAPGVKRLSGRDEFRLRVGDYRILYDLEQDVLTVRVLHVGHRREVYR